MVMQVRADAEKEFDRTMDYIAATIKALKQMRDDELTMLDESGVIAILHRTPIGIICSCHFFFTSSTTAS
jgi:glyceraldehyde-3-phosphate dehydrogenase (NADP+)